MKEKARENKRNVKKNCVFRFSIGKYSSVIDQANERKVLKV